MFNEWVFYIILRCLKIKSYHLTAAYTNNIVIGIGNHFIPIHFSNKIVLIYSSKIHLYTYINTK